MQQKRFQIKVYSQDGNTLVDTVSPNIILSDFPSLSSQIDGSISDMQLRVDINFGDNFDVFALDNILELKIIDNNYPLGTLMFRGKIMEQNPYAGEDEEGLNIRVVGLISLLNRTYYQDGSNYTVTHTAQDPADIIKAIIDHFNTIYTDNFITYTGTSIDNVGVNVSYDFEQERHLEAIKTTFDLVDDGWFWYIDVDGTFYLKPLPTTPTHTATLGKDVNRLDIIKTQETIINKQTVEYDTGVFTAISSASQSMWGIREGQYIKDTNIKNLTTATQRAVKIVNEFKDPKFTGNATLNNAFNREAIRTGDSIRFRNFNNVNLQLDDNIIITNINYSLDDSNLQLTQDRQNFLKELEKLIKSTK